MNATQQVVTGDKQETAIQIANTCRLFGPQDDVLLFNSQMAAKAEKVMLKLLDCI